MTTSTDSQGNLDDVEYRAYLERLQSRFNAVTDAFFTTITAMRADNLSTPMEDWS